MARAGDVDEFDGEDEEALSWVGDEEQGRAAPRLHGRDNPVAVSGADENELAAFPGAAGRRAATAGFVLPYLLLTVGWIFAVQLSAGPDDPFAGILWQFGEFLAMLVAPLWFAATLTITGRSRPLVRVGWLALGLGVLLPWPLILRFLFALTVAGSAS
jgi:hypothetical protein